MWPFFVVVPNPAADYRSRLAPMRLEPMLLDAFFLQGPEEAFDQPVLLRRVGRRELLGEPVGLHCRRIVPTAEDEAVVRAQGQRLMNPVQCAESMDQGLLQRRLS